MFVIFYQSGIEVRPVIINIVWCVQIMQSALKVLGKSREIESQLKVWRLTNILLVKTSVRNLSTSTAMATTTALPKYKFETLMVTAPKEFVYHVELNRPQQFNAMNSAFWR